MAQNDTQTTIWPIMCKKGHKLNCFPTDSKEGVYYVVQKSQKTFGTNSL